jgi:hypothetical protein
MTPPDPDGDDWLHGLTVTALRAAAWVVVALCAAVAWVVWRAL